MKDKTFHGDIRACQDQNGFCAVGINVWCYVCLLCWGSFMCHITRGIKYLQN